MTKHIKPGHVSVDECPTERGKRLSSSTLVRVAFTTVTSAALAMFLSRSLIDSLRTIQSTDTLIATITNPDFWRIASLVIGLAGGLYASFHLYISSVKKRP